MGSLVSRARRVVVARPWISATIGLLAAGAIVAGYLFVGGSPGAQAQGDATTRLVAATIGTVRQSVSTTGTFAPADEEDLDFAASAQVTSVRVAVGDHVAKGQVLGTIDTVALKSALADARATLATAQATLADAQDSGTATDDEIAADEAGVTSAKSAVTSARQALDGATLRAPIAGVVAAVNVATGDVTSGASSNPAGGSATGAGNGSGTGNGNGSGGSGQGTAGSTGSSDSSSSADFVVIGLKRWTVSASVDDTQVGLIKKGDQAQLTTGSGAGTIFGTVASVSVLASTSSGSAAYPVTIDVTGTPAGLHDGASATVSIIYRQLSNVLTVPTLALHRSGSSAYVYVSANGGRQKRTVTTGASSGGTTQITAGLKAGERVYVQVPSVTRTGSGNGDRGGIRGQLPGGGGQFPAGGTVQLPNGKVVQLPGSVGGGK